MKRVIITDIHTPLGLKLLTRFLEQGDEVIGIQSDKENGFKIPKLPVKPRALIYWKKSSSLSSRNLVIKCKSIWNSADTAILLNLLPEREQTIEELSPVAIEQVIDTWLKGPLFFIKDFTEYFKKQNKGMLSVITCSPRAEKNPFLLGGGLYACFESILSALIRANKQGPVNLHGFFIKQLTSELAADYIMKNINEKCYKSGGRLFHY